MDFDKVIKEYSETHVDFGFSAHDEKESAVAIKAKELTIVDLKDRLSNVEKLIMPFLVNLKNAEGDIIKWPTNKRKAELEKQIKSLLELTRI